VTWVCYLQRLFVVVVIGGFHERMFSGNIIPFIAMQVIRIFILVLAACLLARAGYAQYSKYPMKIKAEGSYPYMQTGLELPATIAECRRIKLTSFEKNDATIVALYDNTVADLAVSIYPAGLASNKRFRNEYRMVLDGLALGTRQKLEAEQEHVSYSSDGYTVHGYKALTKTRRADNLMMVLYECGNWFVKLEVTSRSLDAKGLERLLDSAVLAIKPTKLVQYKPVKLIPKIVLLPAAFEDSLLLGSVLAGAFKEKNWASNVDSMERLSGFPSLYLDMHIEAITAFVNFEDKFGPARAGSTARPFRRQLKALIDSEYLDEFILEEHNLVMIRPEGRTFDFDGYHKWKDANNIDVDLHKVYCVIYYGEDDEPSNKRKKR
jgi:hypothetical protein